MFWTNWVRGISKLGMFISIVASIVCGGLLIATEDEFFVTLGIIVIILGILITISLGALIMMISEISINTYNTYAVLKNEHPNDQQSNSVISPQIKEIVTETQPTTENTDNSWVCSCGTRNVAASKYCKNCGKSRQMTGIPQKKQDMYDLVFGSSPQKTNPNDSWVCKCGKRNPNTSDTCASCNRKRES